MFDNPFRPVETVEIIEIIEMDKRKAWFRNWSSSEKQQVADNVLRES